MYLTLQQACKVVLGCSFYQDVRSFSKPYHQETEKQEFEPSDDCPKSLSLILYCIAGVSKRVARKLSLAHRCTWHAPHIIKNTAALFTIDRTQRQPKCPSTEEWVKKMWCIYTVEYYSAIERNGFESLQMWVDTESALQSEVSQKEENKYCILTCVWRI